MEVVAPEHPAAPVLDLRTFEQLYAREYEPMVRLAFLLVDCRDAAEEIVQDAFARVHERWARLDNPGGYLRTCVVNGSRDLRRRAHRLAVRLPRLVARDEGPHEPDYLLDALARLPLKRRAALVLRYYGGFSEAEIADALQVRRGTVKSLLHRALAQLRLEMER